jgi:hypothetical protein
MQKRNGVRILHGHAGFLMRMGELAHIQTAASRSK